MAHDIERRVGVPLAYYGHRTDRQRGLDRLGPRVRRLALRQGRDDRRPAGVRELPDGSGRVRGIRARSSRRQEDRAPRLRRRPLLRGLLAHRGDGGAGPHDAGVRTHEARRARRPDDGQAPPPCRRAAAGGGSGADCVQHGRVPDPHDLAEQARVFRTIRATRGGVFRYGAVHRNTFIDSPRVLDGALGLASDPGVYFAGQIAGTEGYVERRPGISRGAHRRSAPRRSPSSIAASHHGARRTSRSRVAPGSPFQPSNITFSHLVPLEGTKLKKRARYGRSPSGLDDLDVWMKRALAAA